METLCCVFIACTTGLIRLLNGGVTVEEHSVRSDKPGGTKSTRRMPLVILVAASIAVPCVVAESILRWMEPTPDSPGLFVHAANPGIGVLGKPSAAGKFSGAEVRFNRLGLRDRDFTVPRAPGTFRIIALGDSITFGQGVSEDASYPRVTETLLNRTSRWQRGRVEVMNFGIPGYDTLHELHQFRELGVQYAPDLVIVGFLYNDVALSSAEPVAAAREWSFQASINRTYEFLKKESRLLARIAPFISERIRMWGGKGFGQVGAFKYRYVDDDPDWLRVRNALRELRQLGIQHDFELVILIIPVMAKCVEESYPLKEYHEAVATFAATEGIRHLDLLPAFWGIDARKFWISATDGHPNAEGHRLIAETLTEFLLDEANRF